jgi:hypothetical protein
MWGGIVSDKLWSAFAIAVLASVIGYIIYEVLFPPLD